MAKLSYLVTGARRGIGFEMVKQLVASGQYDVTAVVRSAKDAGPLKEVIGSGSDSRIIEFDVTDRESIKKGVEALKAQGVDKIDVLINNAGIAHAYTKADEVPDSVFLNVLKTNVMGPNAVIAEFLPLVAASSKKTVVNISSQLGSISLNSGMPVAAYNVSKAALNMLTKQYSKEKHDLGVTFVSLCPGWVQTDLGGPQAAMTPTESVSSILPTISKLTLEDSGRFINRFGETEPY